MSNTILETIRAKNEELEHLEKALTKSIAYKENNPKEKVVAEMMVNKFIAEIKKTAKDLQNLYEDKDHMKKEEIDILAGNKNFSDSSFALLKSTNFNANRTPDVWMNFYEKVKEIKFINRKIQNDFNDVINYEKMFNATLDEISNKPIFSNEENKGKCVDMHGIYLIYLNLKKIKSGNFFAIDDYLSFLSEFFKFENIPIHYKKLGNYFEYLDAMYKYLKSFFQKSNPMIDMNTILDTIDEEFEQNWQQGKLIGWEDYLNQLRNFSNVKVDNKNEENNFDDDNNSKEINPLFCIVCNKLFTNTNIFEYHKKGKSHLKNSEKIKKENNSTDKNTDFILKTEEISEKILEKIRETNENKEEKVRAIAFYEFSIKKFTEILLEVLENTKNTIRKKQSRNYDEMEAEIEQEKDLELNEEDDDEDEKPIYNPKNVPLGWDGKPIPYWLYKLHGLGIEYKCEICGGASYWGRRAFERHFQEWRHSYGMKCLKIPNTVHFKEVTGIEDSLRLHQALLESQKKISFKPELDEEFEDNDGNVVNKKMFIDLKRQGLL